MTLYTLPTTFGTVDHAPTAAEMTQVINALQSMINATTDYSGSLTLSASVTPPTKGNSTYVASYVQRGQMVFFTGKITIGSTFVAGSGTYTISLPVAASAAAQSALTTGPAMINDSGTSIRPGAVQIAGSTTMNIYSDAVTGAALSNTGPGDGAWAANDWMAWSIEYEAA